MKNFVLRYSHGELEEVGYLREELDQRQHPHDRTV